MRLHEIAVKRYSRKGNQEMKHTCQHCGAYDWAKNPKKFVRAHVSPKDFKTCAKTEKGKRIAKLERLLRYHRQNVFHANDFTADCHSRALGRLKVSKTFAEMCRENEAVSRYRHSERLLSMYA